MAKPCPACGSKKNMYKTPKPRNDLQDILNSGGLELNNYYCRKCSYAEWEIRVRKRGRNENKASDNAIL